MSAPAAESDKPESEKSVTARALSVLAAFDVSHPRMTLSDLARRAGLPIATVHRLAKALEKWGALERDDDGLYGVGFRVWEMGLLAPVHRRLREVALPFMLELHARTGSNVQLAACEGFHAVYVEKLTSEAAVPASSRVGARMPLHATGVGKTLLAHQESPFVETFLSAPLTRHTKWTTTDRRALRRQLAQIRVDGYATSAQEYRAGSRSLAVPILADDRAVAALGLVEYTLDRDLLPHLDALRESANGIAARLITTGGEAFPSLLAE
jgi:DNA-binding IclR family transcriptional regulator